MNIRDWSSDVCSSDLLSYAMFDRANARGARFPGACFTGVTLPPGFAGAVADIAGAVDVDEDAA